MARMPPRLPPPLERPAQLAQATATGDHWAEVGAQKQGQLQGAVLLVVQDLHHRPREDRRLDEPHAAVYASGGQVTSLAAPPGRGLRVRARPGSIPLSSGLG